MTLAISDAVRAAVLYQINNMHTCLPGRIESYDYTTQKASIQPLLNKVYTNGDVVKMPILNNVQVMFPRAGGASLTFPVVEGDTCLLVFSERSLDNWREPGGIVSPEDPRKFDLSDAVAIVGLYPFSEISPAQNNEDVLLTYKNSSITIKVTGELVVNTSSKVAIGNSTTELLDVLSQTLNLLATSVSTSSGTPFGFAANWAALKTQLDLIKGTIP
jgi:hypothetical protein